MSKESNTLFAFLSGAAIGAGLGLLYAPEKGEDTRKRLSDEAGKATDKMKKQWSETSSSLSGSAKSAKADFDAKLDETLSSASYKADDVIVALQKRLEELREKNENFRSKTAQHKTKAATEKSTNNKA